MNCRSHLLYGLISVNNECLPTGIANFIVGLVFLPLRNFLAWGDPLREGRVFYVFAAALAFFTVLLALVYKRG